MSTTEKAVMTTRQVADRMNELFKQYNWGAVVEELFDEDALSIEPAHAQGLQTVKGVAAIQEKGKNFQAIVEEMHGGWVSEPQVGGRFITFAMGMDVTLKGAGRMNMEEIALYEVKDGKIISEQFFY